MKCLTQPFAHLLRTHISHLPTHSLFPTRLRPYVQRLKYLWLCNFVSMGFKVLTTTTMKITVVWDMTPCSLVEIWCFLVTCCFPLQVWKFTLLLSLACHVDLSHFLCKHIFHALIQMAALYSKVLWRIKMQLNPPLRVEGKGTKKTK